jgi:hypothetical protein
MSILKLLQQQKMKGKVKEKSILKLLQRSVLGFKLGLSNVMSG